MKRFLLFFCFLLCFSSSAFSDDDYVSFGFSSTSGGVGSHVCVFNSYGSLSPPEQYGGDGLHPVRFTIRSSGNTTAIEGILVTSFGDVIPYKNIGDLNLSFVRNEYVDSISSDGSLFFILEGSGVGTILCDNIAENSSVRIYKAFVVDKANSQIASFIVGAFMALAFAAASVFKWGA